VNQLKIEVFEKWKLYAANQRYTPHIDEKGNECYLHHGIKVVCVKQPSQYKWGLEKEDKGRLMFPAGYYVLSVKKENYVLIEDEVSLIFLLGFDLFKTVQSRINGEEVLLPYSAHAGFVEHVRGFDLLMKKPQSVVIKEIRQLVA